MQKNQISRVEVIPKNIYDRDDSGIPITKDLTRRETFSLPDLLIVVSKTYSYIVDWQLPEMEQHVVDQSHS